MSETVLFISTSDISDYAEEMEDSSGFSDVEIINVVKKEKKRLNENDCPTSSKRKKIENLSLNENGMKCDDIPDTSHSDSAEQLADDLSSFPDVEIIEVVIKANNQSHEEVSSTNKREICNNERERAYPDTLQINREVVDSNDDTFKCNLCHVTMNSENCLQAHIQGKKHLKTLNGKNIFPVTRHHFEEAGPSHIFDSSHLIRLHEPSIIDSLISTIDDVPIMELNGVKEIREHAGTRFYCSLCDASYASSSIISHLQGSPHLNLCFEKYLPGVRRRLWKTRRDKEKDLQLLFREERAFGRGSIKVYQEVSPGSSPPPARPRKRPTYCGHYTQVTANASNSDDFLDKSKSDFYCKLCGCHMNHPAMWSSHVIGKKHCKNMGKTPGDILCNAKFKTLLKCSELEKQLSRVSPDYPIVGLDFVRENQKALGLQYHCYLCGATCTTFDILDHLTSSKHMLKYLDNKDPGTLNQVHSFNVGKYTRDQLIIDRCMREVMEIGSGTVEVVVPISG